MFEPFKSYIKEPTVERQYNSDWKWSICLEVQYFNIRLYNDNNKYTYFRLPSVTSWKVVLNFNV